MADWILKNTRVGGKNSRHDSVVSQKFIYIFNAMALAEIKSPCVPRSCEKIENVVA